MFWSTRIPLGLCLPQSQTIVLGEIGPSCIPVGGCVCVCVGGCVVLYIAVSQITPKLNNLKQQALTISELLWVRSLGASFCLLLPHSISLRW